MFENHWRWGQSQEAGGRVRPSQGLRSWQALVVEVCVWRVLWAAEWADQPGPWGVEAGRPWLDCVLD